MNWYGEEPIIDGLHARADISLSVRIGIIVLVVTSIALILIAFIVVA